MSPNSPPPLLLSSLLKLELQEASGRRWAEARLPATHRDTAALLIADRIAWHRCDGAPRYYEAWIDRYTGGPPHREALLDCLVAFIASESIGTRDEPAAEVHLQGLVAEHIWHLLSLENALAIGELVRVDPPGWAVTDSGGDGLAIHRVGSELVFRLWESKAHTGEGQVRDVVNGACRQLDSKALRYLARFSKVGQSLADTELQHFYGSLPQLWRESSHVAGGGISVSTKSSDVADCFTNLNTYWHFNENHQRLGLVVVVDNYAEFATDVREHLWKGL